MKLVDRMKAINEALVDRFLPQRFVFHHVPKCGGTSVARALRMRYLASQATVKPEPSFQAFRAFTGRDDTEQMLIDVLDLREQMLLYLLYEDVRCVSLHVRFSNAAYERFSDRYKFITILREPVSRFISHYNWSSARPGSHGYIEPDFDAFLGSERAARLGAEYAEFFADLPARADIRSDEAVSAAIANLGKFSVVGRLDDLQGFTAALRKELGIRCRIGTDNKTEKRPDLIRYSTLNEAQKERVLELCAPDRAIWSAAFPARS